MARKPRSRSSRTSVPSSKTNPPITQSVEQHGTRKRTLVVSLLAMGAGAVSFGLLMSDDGEKSQNKLFSSQAHCERDSAVPKEECAVQYKAALAAHEKNAPKYPVKVGCELDYGDGQCVVPSSGTHTTGSPIYYAPRMTGYLLGRASSGRYQSAPLYRKRNDPPGQFRQMAPFPQSASNTTGRSPPVARSSLRGRTWSARSGSTRVSTGTSRTSRGGFGRSSRGYSGG